MFGFFHNVFKQPQSPPCPRCRRPVQNIAAPGSQPYRACFCGWRSDRCYARNGDLECDLVKNHDEALHEADTAVGRVEWQVEHLPATLKGF